MTEIAQSQAQLIDPLLNLAAGLNDFPQSEHIGRSFGAIGKLSARLLIATASLVGVTEATDLFSNAEVAHADYRCAIADYIKVVAILDANGNNVGTREEGWCYGDSTPAPQPTSPPNNGGGNTGGGNGGGNTGGGNGGGNTGGGNGGGKTTAPTRPSEPSWGNILAFSGCGDGLGDEPFSQQIDALGAKPGIQRLEEMIAKCALAFNVDATDASQNNWNNLIALPAAHITPPDANQSPAMSGYMQNAWDVLHAPVIDTTTTIPVEETTTSVAEETTTVPVEETTTSVAEETTTVPVEETVTTPDTAIETTSSTAVIVPSIDAGVSGPTKPEDNSINFGLIFGTAAAGAILTFGALRLRAKLVRDRLATGYGTKPKRGPGTTGLTGGMGSAGVSAGN